MSSALIPPPEQNDAGEVQRRTSSVTAPDRPPARIEPDIPPLLQKFLIFMVVIVAAYVAGVYNPTNIRLVDSRHSRGSCDTGSWSLANLPLPNVSRYRWEPSLPFAAQLAGWREPVILTNTFVTTWKALERWSTDQYLQSKVELARMPETMVVSECQMKPSNGANPLARANLVKAPENFYSLNATSATFFSRYNSPAEDSYWYWYGKVEGTLVDDVEPSEGLWVDAQDLEQFGLYMWLSGPDIGPWWHYDQDHNFYVQVAGTKRFILIPPWQSHRMHPFPQIHPRNHKSQVDFDRPNMTSTPLYADIDEAYIAELNPGEVLYIPPYWWHHVRSHTRSVSLASWSQSGVYRTMRYGLYKREFAFDHLPPNSAERRTAFRFLLFQIARKLYGASLSPAHIASNTLSTSQSDTQSNTEESDASASSSHVKSSQNVKNFFQQLVAQRWEPIREEIETNSNIELTDSYLAELCGAESLQDEVLKLKLVDDVKAAVEAFENCQTKVASGSKGIGKERRDMQAIRDVEFGDFTEFMLSNEVGAEHVLPFLDHCLLKEMEDS